MRIETTQRINTQSVSEFTNTRWVERCQRPRTQKRTCFFGRKKPLRPETRGSKPSHPTIREMVWIDQDLGELGGPTFGGQFGVQKKKFALRTENRKKPRVPTQPDSSRWGGSAQTNPPPQVTKISKKNIRLQCQTRKRYLQKNLAHSSTTHKATSHHANQTKKRQHRPPAA